MIRIRSRFLAVVLFSLLGVVSAPVASDVLNNLVINELAPIDKKRVGRTLFEFTYHVNVTNTGIDAANIMATVTNTSPYVQLLDDALAFGVLNTGKSGYSTDTLRLRIDRRHPFDPDSLRFAFSGDLFPEEIQGLTGYMVKMGVSDPMLAKMSYADGDEIAVYGVRDTQGFSTEVNELLIQEGSDETTQTWVTLNEANGVQEIRDAQDNSLAFELSENGELFFTAYIPGEGMSVESSVNLNAIEAENNPNGTQAPVSAIPVSDLSGEMFHEAVLADEPQVLNLGLSEVAMTATVPGSSQVSVDVIKCQQPFEHATTIFNVTKQVEAPPTGPFAVMPEILLEVTTPYRVKGDANGRYSVSIPPLGGSLIPTTDIKQFCGTVTGAVGLTCKSVDTIKYPEATCAAVGAAIFALTKAPHVGTNTTAACIRGMKAAKKVCTANGKPATKVTGLVCGAVAAAAKGDLSPRADWLIDATVVVNGQTRTTNVSFTPDASAPQSVVLNTVDFGDRPTIDSFKTTPAHPSPLSDYTVTAASTCTTGWTSKIDVVGSFDQGSAQVVGYRDSASKINLFDGDSISLCVPAPGPGVLDELSYRVTPPDGILAHPLSFEIKVFSLAGGTLDRSCGVRIP